MPKKINHGEMFVTPNTKRKGSFDVKIPTVWSKQKELKVYFSARKYKHPKLSAQRFVREFLHDYYGKARAEYIISIPQFVQRMRLGCQVNIMDTTCISRGKKYPKIAITWTEFSGRKSKRMQKSMLYTEENRVEKFHQASLFAAKKRAELTNSTLHSAALNFEYDLTYLK